MTDAQVIPFPPAVGASANPAQRHSRVPAVIGIQPWSWRGDDNTGNMIHAAAARRMISRYAEYIKPGEWTDADIERLRSEYSHIVYVTANLLRLGVRGDHPSIRELVASQISLAKNIERAGLPVVVFGLGSQAGLNGPYEFTAAPETIRLLKVLSDHSRKIAVRGAFTAEACIRLGIKNVEVVGCQSMFWHRLPQFNWPLSERLADTPEKIAFNFTDAPSEANLINQAMARGHDLIGQQNDGEEDLKAQRADESLAGLAKLGWGPGPIQRARSASCTSQKPTSFHWCCRLRSESGATSISTGLIIQHAMVRRSATMFTSRISLKPICVRSSICAQGAQLRPSISEQGQVIRFAKWSRLPRRSAGIQSGVALPRGGRVILRRSSPTRALQPNSSTGALAIPI